MNRSTSPDGVYYASVAQGKAHQARRQPKPLKLVNNEALCAQIAAWMDDGWSPKLISSMLAVTFPDDQSMQVSHETIYQALYVQTRGNLRADLAEKLRLKRKKRVPGTPERRKNSPYKDAFKISDRPAEVEDRAIPGHWEGDLIIGRDETAIGTLIERTSRFSILLHLPENHTADTVATAMIREMGALPERLRRSITWDRGRSSPSKRRSRLRWMRRSTSATRTRPGSAAATRTRTGCCGSGSRKVPTSPPTHPRTSAGSPRR